jgi:hypothetical protein
MRYLALQGFPLFLQGTPPRYSCLRGADCFHPCRLFFRLRRLPLFSDRWHHRQHLCRHCRAVLDRLRSHWAGGRWFAFRHPDTASRSVTIDVEGGPFEPPFFIAMTLTDRGVGDRLRHGTTFPADRRSHCGWHSRYRNRSRYRMHMNRGTALSQ